MAMQLSTASKAKLLKVRMFLWLYDVASLDGSTQGQNAIHTRGCVDTCRAETKSENLEMCEDWIYALFGGWLEVNMVDSTMLIYILELLMKSIIIFRIYFEY